MTEKQLEDLGYNPAAVAVILEMIAEIREEMKCLLDV